jgi:hypothetical protein
MEQLYLEQLIVKPMPKKQGNILVKFKDIHLPKDKEIEETPNMVNVKIVDKRNEMNVNRQLVIDRLKDKNIFQIRRQEPPRKSAVIGSEIMKINVIPFRKTDNKLGNKKFQANKLAELKSRSFQVSGNGK